MAAKRTSGNRAKGRSKLHGLRRAGSALVAACLLVSVAGCGGVSAGTDASSSANAPGAQEGTSETAAPSESSAPDESATTDATPTSGVAEPTSNSQNYGALNMDSFLAIRLGMSHAEVAALLGSDGSLEGENESNGVTMSTYQWESQSGSWAGVQVILRGDQVISKAQLGLGSDSAPAVTIEQYEGVKEGMSYQDVAQVMGGDGQLQYEANMAGSTMQTFFWDGVSLGEGCTVYFRNGAVSSVSQVGLEESAQ